MKPLAFALAIPASLRCNRAAGVIAFGLPLLRLPSADITADMSDAVTIGLKDRRSDYCAKSL